MLTTPRLDKPMSVVVGNVRVQALSPSLVRIELKGPNGFEDRETFTVVRRAAYEEKPDVQKGTGITTLAYKNFRVAIPARLRSTLNGVKVSSADGKALYEANEKLPKQSFLPGPSDKFDAWAMADSPRMVPPAWGATAPPMGNTLFPDTSGWDTTNDAPDLYVFVPGQGGYQTLRKDFLELTGHTPMIPKWAFGFWDSQWFPYTEQLALDEIDKYHQRGFPLDGFVVDTDWRVSGSHGYRIAKKFFPDMKRFLKEAHGRGVHLMFNDHPEPVAETALDPLEMQYRWDNLTALLRMGMDVWWYDRNWMTHLHEPMRGISKEVWGQRVFHDVTQRFRPDQRPLIMSNVEGIDNGERKYAPHPAGHRYPITWTGDTGALWPYLRQGIANGVDSGVISLLPYVNEDLGGHWAHPTPELYVRFLEYGAFSPIMRVHCTLGQDRHPWTYGDEAEGIVRDYINLRYRLLPTLYSASRRNFEDGTPILRRCDLEWPQYAEAADPQQFLFGDDLLVAPVNEGLAPDGKLVPGELLKTSDNQPGFFGEYFDNAQLEGKPNFTRVDPAIDFDWSKVSPKKGFPRENFSVRWTGTLGPIPESGQYLLGGKTDDGLRYWIDGKQIINSWIGRGPTEDLMPVKLEKGKTYQIKIEYNQLGGGAVAQMTWVKPSEVKEIVNRSLWIPPGEWEDAWTGETIAGPKTITVPSPLGFTPLYVRKGGILFLADHGRSVEDKPWDPIVIEAYVPTADGTTERTLYEDDGLSNDYLKGMGRQTVVRLTRVGSKLTVEIGGAVGKFKGALADRAWVVRVHLPKGEAASAVNATLIEAGSERVSMPFLGKEAKPGPAGGSVLDFSLPSAPVSRARQISLVLKG